MSNPENNNLDLQLASQHCRLLSDSTRIRLLLLLDREAELDQLRRSKSGDYRPAHQVEVLIAILGEAQLMRATALNVI